MKKIIVAVACISIMYACIRLYCNAWDAEYTADQIAALDDAQYEYEER